MSIHSFEFEAGYLRDLVAAGFKGVASAQPADRLGWAPAVIGSAAGALGGGIIAKAQRRSFVAAGLLGTVVGGGAAWLWSARSAIRPACRQSARLMVEVRDAHWLASHPIDYA